MSDFEDFSAPDDPDYHDLTDEGIFSLIDSANGGDDDNLVPDEDYAVDDGEDDLDFIQQEFDAGELDRDTFDGMIKAMENDGLLRPDGAPLHPDETLPDDDSDFSDPALDEFAADLRGDEGVTDAYDALMERTYPGWNEIKADGRSLDDLLNDLEDTKNKLADAEAAAEAATTGEDTDVPAIAEGLDHLEVFRELTSQMKEEGEYLEQKAILEADIAQTDRRIENAERVAENYKQTYRNAYGVEESNGVYDAIPSTAKAYAQQLRYQQEFLRPETAAGKDYREHVADYFASEAVRAIPDGLPVRFVGMPVWATRTMLEQGVITTPPDPRDAQVKQPAPALIVEPAGNLQEIVQRDINLSTAGGCVPPGCVFAVLPESATSAENSSTHQGAVSPVDVVADQGRLFGIATSQETLGTVKQWAAAAGLDPNKVCEYFDLAERLANLQQAIDYDGITLQDIVPYMRQQTE